MTSHPDKPAGGKGKGKTKAAKAPSGLEILSSAKLRLKAGRRYALIGNNGSGKSTLLKAIAEKLIPGIPEEARIAILQQTDPGHVAATATDTVVRPAGDSTTRPHKVVLEEVIEKATSKDVLEHEVAVLTEGIHSADDVQIARSLRQVRHERMQKRLFVLDKMARLRSGARGMQARKELIAFEKEVAEVQTL